MPMTPACRQRRPQRPAYRQRRPQRAGPSARERLPRPGTGYRAEAVPHRVAADSIVNPLAKHTREFNLGQVDMREHLHQR